MAYIGNVPAEKYTALTQQTFSTPTGTSFTLSQAVTNSVDIDLYIDNVKQDPASYSVSGTALTTSTIASPSTMYCIYNGKAMQTVNPPDDSVGLAQLAGGTDGNIISYDASGNPVAVATGTDGQVLTSAGAGQPCAFETLTTGKVVQVVKTQTGAAASGTTLTPADDTIPTSSEGNAVGILDTAITPTNSSNRLIIEGVFNVSHSAAVGGNITVSLFQDSGSAALAVSSTGHPSATIFQCIPLRFEMAAATTSATTFKIRIGYSGAGTTTLNSVPSNRMFGGVMMSSLQIMEIAV